MVKNSGKIRVVHMNKPDRLYGSLKGLCCNECHRISHVADLVITENRLVFCSRPHAVCPGDIAVCQHIHHTGARLCLFRMEAHDLRMRSVTPQDFEVEHAGEREVSSIHCLSGQFVPCIHP